MYYPFSSLIEISSSGKMINKINYPKPLREDDNENKLP